MRDSSKNLRFQPCNSRGLRVAQESGLRCQGARLRSATARRGALDRNSIKGNVPNWQCAEWALRRMGSVPNGQCAALAMRRMVNVPRGQCGARSVAAWTMRRMVFRLNLASLNLALLFRV